MRRALRLAMRGLGRTWPNPTVGCVLVKGGRVVGQGRTAHGGRPHAERVALDQAGAEAAGATAYVTLEPCSHFGKTPPCADALIDADVRRVVVASDDPDPRVAGRGLDRLRSAGIAVTTGVAKADGDRINQGFFSRVVQGRPLVSLKVASTLDGRIATATGASQWITGTQARAKGHMLRAIHDGILVGSGTVLSDDPLLTTRLAGFENRTPVRIVIDRRLRLSPHSRLARSANESPVWVVTGVDADRVAMDRLQTCGVRILTVSMAATVIEVLETLGSQGLTRLLVEGGRGVATALVAAGLVDRLEWFRNPSVLGDDGMAAIGPLGLTGLEDRPMFEMVSRRQVGRDLWERYEAVRQA